MSDMAREASLFICGHAKASEGRSVKDDARELLEMCGLIPPREAAS